MNSVPRPERTTRTTSTTSTTRTTRTTRMHRLELADGHLAYACAGTGAGDPPVVLLHGGYLHHRMWDREIAHLSRRHRVVAPDARAHGGSSTPLAPFRQCDDIAALVRHLGAGPAILIGVSMGGAAAVDTALEHPDVVAALVVSGAGTNEPVFDSPQGRDLMARLEAAEQAMDAQTWLDTTLEAAAGPRRSLDEVDPRVLEQVRTMNEHFVAHHVVPGVVPPEHVPGSWERLGEITVPVLGIVGALDYEDHHRMCHRLLDGVADGRGVVTIEGAGHFPNLERPQEWARAVDAFLDEVGSVLPQPATS